MAEEQKINGFFGQLQGPFIAEQQIVNLIKGQCNNEIDYITKLGIHFIGNHKIFLDGNTTKNLYVNINNIPFQIGITRMLELEDVKITSIVFPEGASDHVYIDYQYKTQ